MPENAPIKNQLLAALPVGVYKKLLPKLERFELVYKKNIYAAGDVIENVYFPESGIVSLLAVVGHNSMLEVGIIGDEGMIGIPLFLGISTSENRAVVQGSGVAMRMTAADFLKESERGGDLLRVLRSFTYSLMMQIGQSAACNRYHSIESRLARWLLMTSDRMRSDEFQITQEFLSYMLGVRREAVNKAASDLQERGLISYVRGRMSLLRRGELYGIACDCYRIMESDGRRFVNN